MGEGNRDTWGVGNDGPELRRPVLLVTVGDEMEAGVIQSLLESCGIASRRRDVGVGAFMGVVLGTNRYGIEIDVAEEDLETAKRILDARPLDERTAEDLLAAGDAEPAEILEPEPETEPEAEAEGTEDGLPEDGPMAAFVEEEPDEAEPKPPEEGLPAGSRVLLVLFRILIGAALLFLFLVILGVFR